MKTRLVQMRLYKVINKKNQIVESQLNYLTIEVQAKENNLPDSPESSLPIKPRAW